MSGKPLRIAVADDHPIVLEGIKLLFEKSGEYDIVGGASNHREITTLCLEKSPDILILDLNLGGNNSLEIVEEIKTNFPALKILIFSSYQTSLLVRKSIRLGVNGYLLKDATKSDWLEALSAIQQGRIYLSKSIRHFEKEMTFEEDSFSQITQLSDQEKKVVKLIIQGLSEQQISENLFISKHTVHSHKKNILRKLNLHTNAELVKFAYENKLV